MRADHASRWRPVAPRTAASFRTSRSFPSLPPPISLAELGAAACVEHTQLCTQRARKRLAREAIEDGKAVLPQPGTRIKPL